MDEQNEIPFLQNWPCKTLQTAMLCFSTVLKHIFLPPKFSCLLNWIIKSRKASLPHRAEEQEMMTKLKTSSIIFLKNNDTLASFIMILSLKYVAFLTNEFLLPLEMNLVLIFSNMWNTGEIYFSNVLALISSFSINLRLCLSCWQDILIHVSNHQILHQHFMSQ